jgi:hypothetical protein
MKYISSSFGNKIGMMLLFLMFGLLANAQSRKVTGQVIDDKGEVRLFQYWSYLQ